MAYVIECIDKKDGLDIRKANRDAHLAYLKDHMDKVIAAGPLLSEEAGHMTGSLLIMDFHSEAEADHFCDNDPYAKAGLFQSITVRPWKKVFPA